MQRQPEYETGKYKFYVLRGNVSVLIRKRDNFVQTFSDPKIIEQARHCYMIPEMYAGENREVFDKWATS